MGICIANIIGGARPPWATMLVLAAILACSPAGAEQGRGESATPPESRGLLLELAPDKTRVYLHQPVSVTVTLLSDSVIHRMPERNKFV